MTTEGEYPASDEPVAETPSTEDTQDTEQTVQRLLALPATEVAPALSALTAERDAGALPILSALAHQAPLPLATMAMEALVALRSQEAAGALAAIGADRSDAAKAKEARRCLHKLSLAGIKPEPVVAAPSPAPQPDSVYACLASAVDGEGTRSITIIRQNRFGTLRMGVFMLSETLGVLDVAGSDPCSMSLWKRYLAESNEQDFKLVPVELAFAQRQIETAVALNERKKMPLPQHYYMFMNLAMGASTERPRPAELNPDAVRANPDLLAQSAGLFGIPECRTWFFRHEEVRPYALRLIAERRRQERQPNLPVMDLSEVQREGTAVSVAMSELFDGARRSLIQERLEYTADVLWRADRLEHAQAALAAALALSPESTLPVEQHPFLREMMVRNLDLAVRMEEAGLAPGEETPAVGQAENKTATADEYVDDSGMIRRKSGLILPR